jgi:signal transduction histidine kinase
VVEQIGGAAGRALDEARQAIHALTRPSRSGVRALLAAGGRGPRAPLRRPDDHRDRALRRGDSEQAEAVLRITAEALRNAVRHGAARSVFVALSGAPVRLEVQDDGRGFDPAASSSGGFGLTSMRERAEGLGS